MSAADADGELEDEEDEEDDEEMEGEVDSGRQVPTVVAGSRQNKRGG